MEGATVDKDETAALVECLRLHFVEDDLRGINADKQGWKRETKMFLVKINKTFQHNRLRRAAKRLPDLSARR